ncbi:bifunctional riboflavin kinase/FAD synthetase [Granulosicoccus antarcticus]|uniref:Riboflavin biosynthesis protein n=1 Tax=Granulosicoccus antarcticus IMCC3135 TaxID=1192854 RepID=A0A2Z2NKP7_9GAMM|nr:bifunctional riboflavin kinase/FAD synthetase [Granulosicoccus antarcticus]ASJ70448.1 Riboflavin biosynthesis protein RibF [Granulosicoccus antarcticus IMCC3135]
MQLIRGLNRWPDNTESVVTIGNFDGVHLGHQSMLASLRSAADTHQLPATVISFEPLPQEYFMPQSAPSRLQGLRDRVRSIEASGVDRLVLLDFDSHFAEQSAEDFISDVLIEQLQTRHLIIGDDFCFGHKRRGNFQMLTSAAKTHGFTLQRSHTCLQDEHRISSTRVREHLSKGELAAATSLLGRPYRISGRVIHGEKVGRQLGFPTANVALGVLRPALRGVFAVWACDLERGTRHAAVANLGERPTVGGRKLLLEVHLLDAEADLYGHHLAVDFIAQLRHEQRFASLDELKMQIARDADAARELMKDQMTYTDPLCSTDEARQT